MSCWNLTGILTAIKDKYEIESGVDFAEKICFTVGTVNGNRS